MIRVFLLKILEFMKRHFIDIHHEERVYMVQRLQQKKNWVIAVKKL